MKPTPKKTPRKNSAKKTVAKKSSAQTDADTKKTISDQEMLISKENVSKEMGSPKVTPKNTELASSDFLADEALKEVEAKLAEMEKSAASSKEIELLKEVEVEKEIEVLKSVDAEPQKKVEQSTPPPPNTPIPPVTPTNKQPAMNQKNNLSSPKRLDSKLLTVFALILASGAVTFSVFMWQRMGHLEESLKVSVEQNTATAKLLSSAEETARKAMLTANATQDNVTRLSDTIDVINADGDRIDMLVKYISNSKSDMLPINVRSILASAELQTQLTGSIHPLLGALQSIDKSLEEEGLTLQSPLRNAIRTDIDNIRNYPSPSPMGISKKVAELLDIVNRGPSALPLIIDPPQPNKPLSLDVDLSLPTGGEPSADSSTWGSIKNAWSWTTDKASEVGSAAWTQLGSLVEITPLNNRDAVLLSGADGALLRENIKLRLMSVRIAVLQRDFKQAKEELIDIENALETYFDTNNRSVQDVQRRIKVISADLEHVSLPQPSATNAVLAALSHNQ